MFFLWGIFSLLRLSAQAKKIPADVAAERQKQINAWKKQFWKRNSKIMVLFIMIDTALAWVIFVNWIANTASCHLVHVVGNHVC